jgi:hypothetical protein
MNCRLCRHAFLSEHVLLFKRGNLNPWTWTDRKLSSA